MRSGRSWTRRPLARWNASEGPAHTTTSGSVFGTSGNLRLIERFTRVDADTIDYQFTVTDPAIFTKPWTAALFMKKSKDQVYEYACHEGNEAMSGTLSGARAKEKAAARTGQTSSK